MLLTTILAAVLSITATPRVGIAPLTVRVEIKLPTVGEVRELCLVVSDGVPQYSCWPPYGRTVRITFDQPGMWDVWVAAKLSSGRFEHSNTVQIEVR